MNFTYRSGTDKARIKRARAARKPKIRWEILGLQSLPVVSLTTSMEDIRREVRLASLNQGNRSCVAERNANTSSQAPDSSNKSRRGTTDSSNKSRRGATESSESA